MLKRTTGRLLLSLLVATGLAGTINNNSLSKSERKYALGMMRESYKEVLSMAKNFSEAQLHFKSGPEKWSVKECFYHIAVTENALFEMLENAMKSPSNPEKRSEIKVTDEVFVNMLRDRTNKVKTAEPFEPSNTKYKSLDEAMEDFKQNRMAHIKYMKTSTEDMRNHVVQMPFGYIDCYQLYLMLSAHCDRHLQQIEEVRNSPGFPAK